MSEQMLQENMVIWFMYSNHRLSFRAARDSAWIEMVGLGLAEEEIPKPKSLGKHPRSWMLMTFLKVLGR